MHKSLRNKVQAARRREDKVQDLAWTPGQDARRERKRQLENRGWTARTLKGELRTGNEVKPPVTVL